MFLLQSQFFLQFKIAHPKCAISQRTFKKLKPWFVKPLNDKNVCCCIYHVEMGMILEAFNTMRDKQKGLHSSVPYICTCVVCICIGLIADDCMAHKNVWQSCSDLWRACICSKGELDTWHHLKCFMGTCEHCGVKILPISLSESSITNTTLLKWKCFEYETIGVADDG
jgi:hypothetical protein